MEEKCTVFRKLAENVTSVVTPFLSLADKPLTAKIALPWDNFKVEVVNFIIDGFIKNFPICLVTGQGSLHANMAQRQKKTWKTQNMWVFKVSIWLSYNR